MIILLELGVLAQSGADGAAAAAWIFAIIAIVAAIVVITQVKGQGKLSNQLRESEQRLQTLRDHARRTRIIEYTDIDVIMFGPRQSGKTSIAELWASPWTQIETVRSSFTWRKYEVDIHKMVEESRQDPLFDVERTYVPTVRVRIHDYPGEDAYRRQAIKDLSSLNKQAVVVFVLNVGYKNGQILHVNDNAQYFSEVFVDELYQNLTNINKAVSKAVVVFNKADTLPEDWGALTSRYLREANSTAMFQIERIFGGNTEYCVTSAKTNRGVIRLLGLVGKSAMKDSPDELGRFMENMRAAAGEFESQRPEDHPEAEVVAR